MPFARTARLGAFATLAAFAAGAHGASGATPPMPSGPASSAIAPVPLLPELATRDFVARDRLFDHGIPVTPESFSPDGLHFVYLHQIPGRFPRRKPERCAFLFDMSTLENRPVKTPKGRAVRVGGWDPGGRNLLLESSSPAWFSVFTGKWTTFHWVYDVVTSQFVPRKPFTGEVESGPFRWKADGTVHGVWKSTERGAVVVPLEAGQLAQMYQDRERAMEEETARRVETARELAVGSSPTSLKILADALPRLDEHWTRRGQRDPVVSDLFGERPHLFARRDGQWTQVCHEVEYVAVLDSGLALLTLAEGRQVMFHPGLWEIAPLPAPPEEFRAKLATRWDRAEGVYDETDPLPRDLQYRRSYDISQGVASYFNYAVPGDERVMIVYALDADHRVLRIVDLPAAWSLSARPASAAPVPSP